ncbi:hypothetical protein [Fibrella forsythiae]|uniref:DUF1129 family protein n=1 Tax=Fibrella forsythiae TaxID=2817061 RepID=A0ABS3JIK9_9BACT|nr:hypothetical protein [Fibrella forsythiae]MBO0949854.1 hypothetical protein [Fibrella forsythiae]
MLTPAQLTLIDKHLRSDNWLLNNDLIAELTDHYADAISDKLAQNVPFEVALQDVHRSFGGRKGLLNMEENYQKTQAQTNSRVYRDAFKKAFQLPGFGYTLLVWAICYGIVRTFPFAAISDKLDILSDFAFFGILCLFTGVFIYAFIAMYRHIQAGTFSLQATSAPTFLMVQSTIWILQLSTWLPIRHFAETQPILCALAMTLVIIHEWAGMHMLAFVYRKRLA